MALARLCLNRALAGRAQARPAYAVRSLFSTSAAHDPAAASGEASRRDREVVAVSGDRSSAPAAARRGGGRWAWRDLRDFTPFRLVDGLGSALSQVAAALSRPLERLAAAAPSAKVREDEAVYRLRLEVPGLGKDDVRVAVEDGGVLVIEGEKREEEHGGGDGDGEWWSAAAATGYHASLLLPDDARADGVTAEVRDGVLYVTVPRSGERRRSVTEVKVQ